jgi:hypothetical protein
MLAGKQFAKVCLLQKARLAPIQSLRGSTAQHSTAQHSTAQHSTAQHSTAQHSTAQHSTARHSTAATVFKNVMLLVSSRQIECQAWHKN